MVPATLIGQDAPTTLHRAVFLDRDGTINYNVDYCRRLEDFHLMPRVVEAVSALNQAGFLVVVITNQSGISRDYFSKETLDAIHEYLRTAMGEGGARIDGIYYCPHLPHHGCSCRKPKPGLIRTSSHELNICLERSFMVGDSQSDIEAGAAAGCRTVMIANGLPDVRTIDPPADYYTDSIFGAVDWILTSN